MGKIKFLVDSKIFKWTNKACFREKLPLANSGSKKIGATERTESSLDKISCHSTFDACGRKHALRRHSHDFLIVKFYTSHKSIR